MLSEAMLPDLVFTDRASERGSLGTILQGVTKRFFGARERADRSRQPLALEILHHVIEAFVHFAENVALRDAALVEEQLGGVGGHVADFVQLLADGKAFGLGGEQNQRDALVAVGAGTNGENNEV